VHVAAAVAARRPRDAETAPPCTRFLPRKMPPEQVAQARQVVAVLFCSPMEADTRHCPRSNVTPFQQNMLNPPPLSFFASSRGMVERVENRPHVHAARARPAFFHSRCR